MSYFIDLEKNITDDPKACVEDYVLQLKRLENALELVSHKPEEENEELCKLIEFVCKFATHYTKYVTNLAKLLMNLIDHHVAELQAEIRRYIAIGLIRLRTSGVIPAKEMLPMLFKMFKVNDKNLRDLAYQNIVADISNVSKQTKSNHIDRSLQNYVFSMTSDSNTTAMRYAINVLIQLSRKRVWGDERTTNMIAEAVFCGDVRSMTSALQYLLGTSEEQEEAIREERENGDDDLTREILMHNVKMDFKKKHSKKTKKRVSKYERAMKKASKFQTGTKELNIKRESVKTISLLYDPQKFSERLFRLLKSSTEKFELRIMMMDVIARCIQTHDLILLNFYPFLQRYLTPSQEYIPRLLAISATSVHRLIPADDLYPFIMTIANNFVNSRAPPHAISAGLKSIYQMCIRQPLIMQPNLLKDIHSYTRHKNKEVFSTAKAIVTFYREENPGLLTKKARGRRFKDQVQQNLAKEVLGFGETKVVDGIEGIELLEEYERLKKVKEDYEAEQSKMIDDEEKITNDNKMNDDDDEEEDGPPPLEDAPYQKGDDSSDEEEEEAKQEEQKSIEEMTQDERDDLKRKISSQRFLTQEDFAKLKVLRMQRKVDEMVGRKARLEIKKKLKKRKKRRKRWERSDAGFEEEAAMLDYLVPGATPDAANLEADSAEAIRQRDLASITEIESMLEEELEKRDNDDNGDDEDPEGSDMLILDEDDMEEENKSLEKREKFKHIDKRWGQGKTNKEKKKNKAHTMLRFSRKVAKKNKYSQYQRKKRNEESLRRQLKHKLNVH
mmetsp:Transcript_9006/g.13343  ORF Transcript_9006/g.13343 Transcript_9006/m.13343 type:complete len:783 (-) Transcript_9006:37-2385(-)